MNTIIRQKRAFNFFTLLNLYCNSHYHKACISSIFSVNKSTVSTMISAVRNSSVDGFCIRLILLASFKSEQVFYHISLIFILVSFVPITLVYPFLINYAYCLYIGKHQQNQQLSQSAPIALAYSGPLLARLSRPAAPL